MCCVGFPHTLLHILSQDLDLISSGKKKEPEPNFFGPDIFGGVGVFHVKGWGPKGSVCPSNARKTKLFGGISQIFWRDIPRVLKKLKTKVGVLFLDPRICPKSQNEVCPVLPGKVPRVKSRWHMALLIVKNVAKHPATNVKPIVPWKNQRKICHKKSHHIFRKREFLGRHACRTKLPPEKLFNRYDKRFEKREKRSEKTIRNATEKLLAPLRLLKNISPALLNNLKFFTAQNLHQKKSFYHREALQG